MRGLSFVVLDLCVMCWDLILKNAAPRKCDTVREICLSRVPPSYDIAVAHQPKFQQSRVCVFVFLHAHENTDSSPLCSISFVRSKPNRVACFRVDAI